MKTTINEAFIKKTKQNQIYKRDFEVCNGILSAFKEFQGIVRDLKGFIEFRGILRDCHGFKRIVRSVKGA